MVRSRFCLPPAALGLDFPSILVENATIVNAISETALAHRRQLDLSEFFPYLINRVGSALVARFSTDALDGKHLSIAMWRVLAALSNNGGVRQIDVAEMTNTEVSTLSR